MRLAIFGATGRTGRIVVEQALQQGHEVTALSRRPEQVPPHPRLRTVRGDVRDRGPVAATLDGADGIISTLGPPRRGPQTCTEGIRTVLSALEPGDPRRLVVLTNYGVGGSRRRSAYVAVSWLLARTVLRDKEHMEALLRSSGTAWTLVRAPVLTDGPRTDDCRTGTDLVLGFTSTASRADLAAFLLAELETRTHLHRAVAITSSRRPRRGWNTAAVRG